MRTYVCMSLEAISKSQIHHKIHHLISTTTTTTFLCKGEEAMLYNNILFIHFDDLFSISCVFHLFLSYWLIWLIRLLRNTTTLPAIKAIRMSWKGWIYNHVDGECILHGMRKNLCARQEIIQETVHFKPSSASFVIRPPFICLLLCLLVQLLSDHR